MSTATHCPYCALQCAMHVEAGPDGQPAVRPADFPTNRGGLCRKGWSAAQLLHSPQRLVRPLVRTGGTGEFAETGWDEALDFVAGRMAGVREQHGPDAVAVFGSGGLTNEKSYLLGKFARLALGTSRIDYNGRFCMSSAAAAGIRAFGLDRGLGFPLPDVASAEVVLLAGANPAETMPPMMGHLSGPRLIVVDPRRSATAEFARERGGLHLAPRPGTDLALALGLLHSARAQDLLDGDYIGARTSGFDEAWKYAAAFWPERTEQVTGVPAHLVRAAARALGTARGAYVLTGRGAEQHATGTDTVSAWINLALALGLCGRAGSGYGCITGQGNGQGGREHGQKADQLPGYRRIDDPAARAHVAGVWGVDAGELPGPGPSAFELLDSLGTAAGPKALLLMGSNPAVSAPEAGRVRDRLSALDLLVTCDFVMSETAAMADVVLPVAQWAEETGTMTNLEGRLLRRRAVLDPPPGVRTDLEVISGLARRLGQPDQRFPAGADAVLAELGRASAGGGADYAGVSPQRLEAGEELFWPVPGPGAGTPRMFLEGFAHADGRARFAAVGHRGAAEEADAQFPLIATTGRLMGHYQSGAQTRRIGELAEAEPEACVEVHPDTGARAGLDDGGWARVVSRRGATLARVRYRAGARTDTVFLPFHYGGEQAANNLTNPVLDPVSRMPEFKVSAVRLERSDPPQDARAASSQNAGAAAPAAGAGAGRRGPARPAGG
ncbi:molybdopterin oxidoreductase family protein [Streptomonospora wellingtoniae]|uniref:Molybdopterin oxidoreductase family protein n=1 Tax=Streptomonospora wellingtoniae TaxID=3075544 RepID=A0ABU2KX19_9ACTN|nr:molybdopterin oxidoreductase family protein [Streptomonospora sp. DSM 45055]MDT0303761.1 molybdopterin oxidoreductase family protein [Streptomonospora sp. DSM 45055]